MNRGQLTQSAAGAGLFLTGAGVQWWAVGSSSALAFGVTGTELICPLTRGAHLFNYHYLPVVGLTVVAFVAGSWWGRR